MLRSSLLQDIKKDRLNNITHCKMHDLVHDVSLKVFENYCFQVKDWTGLRDKIERGERGMPKSLKDIFPLKLRTLHLKGHYVLEDLFENFKSLSVFILEDEEAEGLPNSIGKMKRLRFLDICRTGISRLPKSITKLYYLQTLKVRRLGEIPEGFHKLINLRHFHVQYVFGVPEFSVARLSQLTNLQILPFFNVDKCDGYQIEELANLDDLRGVLRIFNLQNVSSYENALKANLSKKSNIHTLKLHWERRWEEDCDDTDIMEGLKPISNLKCLKIDGYQSRKFPSWMMVAKNHSILLRNLVKLRLCNLHKCERLPSLGDLPCLEYLSIESLDNVKCIGEEFYGWKNIDWVRKINCSGNGGTEITLFPALKSLRFRFMRCLVEWSDAIIPTHSSSSVKVFPVLEEMELCELPKLMAFPNLGSLPRLRRLTISNCPTLAPRKSALTQHSYGVDLCGLPDDIHYLESLREVTITRCGSFTAAFCSLKTLARHEYLDINGSPSLWPKDLHHLVNLRTLNLSGIDAYPTCELDCLPFPYLVASNIVTKSYPEEDVQCFPSLTSLILSGWGLSTVKSLPDQIQYITALSDLHILRFDGLEALPEWIGNITSLRNLALGYCENLKHLPSVEAFQRLTNLEHLRIVGCPLLLERCIQGSGS